MSRIIDVRLDESDVVAVRDRSVVGKRASGGRIGPDTGLSGVPVQPVIGVLRLM